MLEVGDVRAPYPGLRPFESDETPIFFGREAHVSRLLDSANRVCQVRIEPKEPAEALHHFNLARPWIDRAIIAMPEESVYISNLGVLHRRIAGSQRALDNAKGEADELRAGIEAAQRSSKIAELHEGATQRIQRLLELRRAFDESAEFYERRRDMPAAIVAYNHSIDTLREAAQLKPTDGSAFALMAQIHESIADLNKRAGDSGAMAMQLHAGQEARAKAAMLYASGGDVDDAALAFYQLGETHEDQHEWNDALHAYRDAAEQARQAVQRDHKDGVHYRALSVCERKVGEMSRNLDDAAAAGPSFDHAVDDGKRSVELDPENGDNLRGLYQAQWALARFLESRGRRPKALASLDAALQTAKRAGHTSPSRTLYDDDLKLLQREISSH